jgi:malate dehydrogenase (oxaloacetate-decarboxylating)
MVSDMMSHRGPGLISVVPRVPLRTRADLAAAYTPGVGHKVQALIADPGAVRAHTGKGNTVAVVTDGSAVLGYGDVGPTAGLPVMEAKAALFARFAGIDAWPVCLDTQDVDEIVRTVELLAPGLGGINLEDISAPRCFEIERRLSQRLAIPVFHDDQHGTAIVVLAALRNALRLVGKRLDRVRVVLVGAGAAGTAIAELLWSQGLTQLTICDRDGVLRTGQQSVHDHHLRLAMRCHPRHGDHTVTEALHGADVVIGVSTAGAIPAEALRGMARDAIVFALANPEPEIDPDLARRHAAVVATGRTDQPNQINNVLAFPGIFRGLLDAEAPRFTSAMAVAAALALADLIPAGELRADRIIPDALDDRVAPSLARAVTSVAVPTPRAS